MKITVVVEVDPVTYAEETGLRSCADVATHAERTIRAMFDMRGMDVGRVRVSS